MLTGRDPAVKMSFIQKRGLSTLIPPKVGLHASAAHQDLMLTSSTDRLSQCKASAGCNHVLASIHNLLRRQPSPTTRTCRTCANISKVIGSSPNAIRMQKVVSFYEKLPRGPAPEPEGKGLLGRYQKKYMGKNASARRT